jgi:hypothetical protein
MSEAMREAQGHRSARGSWSCWSFGRSTTASDPRRLSPLEIAKELGLQLFRASYADDKRAKVLTINLNEMKGQSLPTLLSTSCRISKELVLEDPRRARINGRTQGLARPLKIPDGWATSRRSRTAGESAADLPVVEDAEVVGGHRDRKAQTCWEYVVQRS